MTNRDSSGASFNDLCNPCRPALRPQPTAARLLRAWHATARSRSWLTWSAAILLVVASSRRVEAADNLIGHKTSLTKYKGVPAVGKLYSFSARAGTNGNPAEFTLPTNPLHGGVVQVQRDAGMLGDPLTAGTWKGLGTPPGSTGWKYTNRDAPTGGAV